jgi:GH43 family beta-xylosidase
MFLITGYCTQVQPEMKWNGWCVDEMSACLKSNKCIIINYKSMAQYVHGTSVQQCVLDQLSGASVAQSTQHVMYHLLIH